MSVCRLAYEEWYRNERIIRNLSKAGLVAEAEYRANDTMKQALAYGEWDVFACAAASAWYREMPDVIINERVSWLIREEYNRRCRADHKARIDPTFSHELEAALRQDAMDDIYAELGR